MDIKDFMPVLTFIVGIFTLWISWMNYKSQRESKPPELARLESWSKLMQEAGVDIGKIDNDGYISSLSKAQKNLVDNYNVFIHRASLEPVLRKIGISDGKVFNKLMSMSRDKKQVKPPGFNNYASSCLKFWYAFMISSLLTLFSLVPVLISVLITSKVDILFTCIFGIFLFVFLISIIIFLYTAKQIIMVLVINNAYYYLRKFYGVESSATDSPFSYRERMKIKECAYIIFGMYGIGKDIKRNVYMAGINEIDDCEPTQEENMRPKNYTLNYRFSKLTKFLIKIGDKNARERGVYPEQGSENVEN